jgi:hypothetical protein
MKEIILISAYTPTTDKQDKLRELISSLKNLNYRVCLATHTSTPQDIVDRCDYHIYDAENKVLYDPYIKYQHFFGQEDKLWQFKDYTSVSTHALPVFRMYLGGLAYLKSMGEEVVHMIEYDTIVKNREVWDNHLELLKEKDAVFYAFSRYYQDNKLICVAGFQSVNVSNINYNLLSYNETKLINQYKEYFANYKMPVFEAMIYDNLWKYLDYHLINLKDEIDLSSSFTLNTDRVEMGEWSTFYYYKDELYFFNLNKELVPNKYTIIVNNSQITNLTVLPGYWLYNKVTSENVDNILLFKNNKLVKELDMSNPVDQYWIKCSHFEEGLSEYPKFQI